MRRLFRLILIYFVIIQMITHLVSGIEYQNNLLVLGSASLILAVFTLIAKPLLQIITLPFQVVTLGLFGVMLQALVWYGISLLVPGFQIGDIALRDTVGLPLPMQAIAYPWSLVLMAMMIEILRKIGEFLISE